MINREYALKKISQEHVRLSKGGLEYCWNPSCPGATQFQWCHLLSKSRQLGVYSEGRGYVYQPHAGMGSGRRDYNFIERSLNRMLVFRGFCNSCDSTQFTELDRAQSLDNLICRQQAQRAASYHHWNLTLDHKVDLFTATQFGRVKTSLPPQFSTHPAFGKNIQEEYDYRDSSLTHFRDSCLRNGMVSTVAMQLSEEPNFRAAVVRDMTTLPFGHRQKIDLRDTPFSPFICVAVIQIGGVQYLIFVFEERLRIFAKVYIEEFSNLLGGTLFGSLQAYFCANNLGLSLPLNAFRNSKPRKLRVAKQIEKLRNNFPSYVPTFMRKVSSEFPDRASLSIVGDPIELRDP